MKLIKLSYIAHGWYLAFSDKQLLDEVIYAWKYGPVISTVYDDFKKYGSSQISELRSNGPDTNDYPFPDDAIKPFLNTIWQSYGKYDGIQLSAMTHQPNTPWDIVWNQWGGNKKKFAIIPNDLIREHYKNKIKEVNARRTSGIVETSQ